MLRRYRRSWDWLRRDTKCSHGAARWLQAKRGNKTRFSEEGFLRGRGVSGDESPDALNSMGVPARARRIIPRKRGVASAHSAALLTDGLH